MLCIISNSNNPEFNLAAEEYLFKSRSDDVFFLYVNSTSVIVGRNQNALAEINADFIFQNKIPVIRRLSGGGAVYHDLGNLNFSFHQTVRDPVKVSFSRYTCPIAEALHQLGVPAEVSKRNDIFVNGFKVSGHAEHVFRNRILSHGTILFNAERKILSETLRNCTGIFNHKAIRSVRSEVANVVDFIEQPLSMQQFVKFISDYIVANYSDVRLYEFNRSEILEITKLVNEKYSKWEWNFGRSSKYKFERSLSNGDCSIAVSLSVKRGLIKEIKVDGILETAKEIIQKTLLDCPHQPDVIEKIITDIGLPENVRTTLIKCFF